MYKQITTDNRALFQILAITIIVVCLLFIWEGNKGLSLSDEGHLWYGVQRVMLGEVPKRDFAGYDPGRYYWSATIMTLMDDNGILALRGAVSIFQALGLFVGLILINSALKRRDLMYLLLSAIILTAWMIPRHKLFDISLSILLIGVLTFLVQSPTSRRYFIAGVFVGLVAVFGRNHGVYGVFGSAGVMLWLSIKCSHSPTLIKGFTIWAGGVATGFSPVLLMILFVPGFAMAFWESIRWLFEVKTTNLPLPVPWPWLVDFNSVSIATAARGALTGIFFIGVAVFGLASIIWLVWQKIQDNKVIPAFVAASFLAIPYAHYAYSRADVSHLAQGIFPLLVGCLVLLASRPARFKWPLSISLCMASLWTIHIYHPGWACIVSKRCESIEVSGNDLLVGKRTARDVALLRKLSSEYAPGDRSFLVTPYWPGAYALLERKAPVWEIYALFPRSRDFEQSEIERLINAEPSFILIIDLALDGREEWRFRNTHPDTYQYIQEHFVRLPDSVNPAYQVYIEKQDVR